MFSKYSIGTNWPQKTVRNAFNFVYMSFKKVLSYTTDVIGAS